MPLAASSLSRVMGKGGARRAGKTRPVGQMASGGQSLPADDQGQVELPAGHGRGRLGQQPHGDRSSEPE
jgi:hypothetical protein